MQKENIFLPCAVSGAGNYLDFPATEMRSMGKATYGTGHVTPRGKKWYGYPRIPLRDPITGKMLSKRKPIIIGLRSKMTKTEAREALAREVAKRKGWFRSNGRVMNDGSVTFAWFVCNRYFPLKECDWKAETAKTKKSLIQTNLLDDLGEIPLVNFDRFALQLQVNKLAKTCARDTALQMRAYLRDIFEEAVDQDFLIKDPAARIRVPTQLRETDKTTLTWEQLRAALESVDAEDRILLELDMTDALRPSELFALRWKCFDPETSSLDLQETVYRGKLRNHGKTKKSLAKIHISALMVSDLQAWKIICPDSSPEAFIFPNREGGVRDPNNFRKRVLGQLREKLNLSKLSFQVIRRTMATLSQTKGGVKDTQGMLRHARLPTTTDVYMQVIPEGVKQMINSMHDELRNRR
ncbi:MAG TPA: tyrosine-type recombinase/integrase [Terracidiphilus sp.]